MGNKNIKMTRERVEQILSQAKESVKILESLQKESLSKAKDYVKIPASLANHFASFLDGKMLSKDAIVKNMGIATKDDLRKLNDRIDDLASELRSQISQISKKNRKESSKEKQN